MTDLALTLPAALNISEKTAELFARAGITTLRELILHLPLRYEDRSHLTPIAALRDGVTVQICGEIIHADLIQRQRRILTVTVRDEAGDMCKLLYFNYYPSQQKAFVPGRRGLYYGKACWTPRGYQIHHPEITWLEAGQIPQLAEHLYPVYPTVKGLGQARWQGVIKKALDLVLPTLPEADPLTAAGYLPLSAALTALHRPPDNSSPDALLDRSHPARRRLILEELCAHQLAIQNARARVRSQRALALSADAPLLRDFRAALPYTLTRAQERVCAEIAADLAQSTPMMRLVQGDVGSGKTIVALAAIADGSAQLIIGTHAVFQEHVAYARLALVVIDEQHRFGVHQRLQLQEKTADYATHQLVLTATPIPRTLAMSLYGELDLSIIDTLPAGRRPIQTNVVANHKRDTVIARVGANCRDGRQAYWVCPLIEESDALECENAAATAEQLQTLLPDIRVALIHGKMANDERQAAMAAFVAGEAQLLVATTVIEVGVDVANATLMIIENAERFGLAQLHQLRGRVGRGSEQSYCLLMYQPPLGDTAQRRLRIMRETTDGFRIAEEDLAIRGAGELLGTRQTGEAMFRVAKLPLDADLLGETERLTRDFRAHHPDWCQTLLGRWTASRERYLSA